MARTRLVDPMAVVEAVSRDALGVTTQAEADAAAGTLERYRDTDDARRDAPVVAGSTADGTALVSLVAALKAKGIIVDGTDAVEDEVVTGRVSADIVDVTTLQSRRIDHSGFAEFAIARIVTTLNGAINSSTTSVVVTDASEIAAATFIRIDDEPIYVSSKSGNTLTVSRSVRYPASHSNGADVWIDSGWAVNDGAQPDYVQVTHNVTAINNTLELGKRLSVINAPGATVAKQAAAGSTGAAVANGYATDIAGTVQITPNGTGIAAGIQARVTFVNARAATSEYAVLVTPSANAAALQVYVSRDPGYISLGVNVAPTANVAFLIHYLIIDLA